MTREQIERVDGMRQAGMTFTEISAILNVPVGTIKASCHRRTRKNALDAQEAITPSENDGIEPELAGSDICSQCGNHLFPTPRWRRKRFCSDACRMKWWRAHQGQFRKKGIQQTCPQCGAEFHSYPSQRRKYCSHACFIAHHFKEVACDVNRAV